MNKVIIVDRDGTLLKEPYDEQIDALEKVEFVPGAISGLKALSGLGYKLVMASNQDGLGTPAFPEETFWPAQKLLLKTLEGEGVVFDDILIDPSFPEDKSPNRKPGTGMFGKYLDGTYDLAASWVIGDRETDRKNKVLISLGVFDRRRGRHRRGCSWQDAISAVTAHGCPIRRYYAFSLMKKSGSQAACTMVAGDNYPVVFSQQLLHLFTKP